MLCLHTHTLSIYTQTRRRLSRRSWLVQSTQIRFGHCRRSMCGRLFFLAPIVCRPHTLAHLTTVREETKHNKSSGVKEINPKSGVTGRQQLLLSLSCYGFLQIVGGPPSNGNRKRSSRFFTPRREKSHTHKHTQLDTNGENILVVVFLFIQKKNS